MQTEYFDKEEQVVSLISELNLRDKTRPVVIDLETTGLDPRKDSITHVGISGPEDHVAVVFPAKFVKVLSDLKAPLLLHNFRFDLAFLHHQHSIDLSKNRIRDTMLMHHLYDENKLHGLDSIIKEWWGDDYKERFWDGIENYSDRSFEQQLEYAGKDIVYTLYIYRRLCREFMEQGITPDLVEHVHKLAMALYATEVRGVKVDLDFLQTLDDNYTAQIAFLEQNMRSLVDVECSVIETRLWDTEKAKRKTEKGKAAVPRPNFNFNSGAQLKQLVYGELKIEPVYGESKTPTLDDAAIKSIADKHPFLALLRDYRGATKIKSSFIDGVREKMTSGRIYPSFNINGTVTGRISSSNPNMQQIPRDGNIRGMFIPEMGHKIISVDFGQLEIVLAAHFSADPVLIKLIKDGKSMHDHTAEALNIPRQMAKTINFLTIYGGSEYKLSKVMNCSIEHAQDLLARLWNTYKGLKLAIDRCHAAVEAGTPIKSPFGRLRRFPTKYNNKWDKERAKRQAFNALIQGTGADLTHTAFYLTKERLEAERLGTTLFEVHDEIVVMAKDNACEQASKLVVSTMESVGSKIGLLVPLTAEAGEPVDRWSK